MGANRIFRVTVAGNSTDNAATNAPKTITPTSAAENKYKLLLIHEKQENTRLRERATQLETENQELTERLKAEQRRAADLEREHAQLLSHLEQYKTAYEQKNDEAGQLAGALQQSLDENTTLAARAESLEDQCTQLDELRHQLSELIVETKQKTERYAPSESAAVDTAAKQPDFFRSDISEFRKNLSDLENRIAGSFADISAFIGNAHLEIEEPPTPDFEPEVVAPFDFGEPYFYTEPDEPPQEKITLEVEAKLVETYDEPAVQPSEPEDGEPSDKGYSPLLALADLQQDAQSTTPRVADKQAEADEPAEETPPVKRRYWPGIKLKRESIHASKAAAKEDAEDDFVEEAIGADPLFSAPIWADEPAPQKDNFRKRFDDYRNR